MWESKSQNEPADLKLLAIRFFRKIWILLLAIVTGAVVCGTGYYVKHVLLAPAPEYVAHSMMYVDFVRGEGQEPKYYTFNTAGWSGFVKTDEILDKAMEVLGKDPVAQQFSTVITKEEMRASVDASVDADYRVVDLLVTNTDPHRAVVIAHAVEQAFPVFGDSMQEIQQIRVLTSADTAKRVWVDTATWRAVIWGGILGGLLVFFILLIRVTLDDSVYVPETLRRRYGYPVLGVMLASDNRKNAGNQFREQLQRQLEENRAYFCGDAPYLEIKTGKAENIFTNPELLSQLNAYEGAVLIVPSGAQNGKLLEETMGQVEQRGKQILGMILTEGDEHLLKAYYHPLWTAGKENKISGKTGE
ncbi:MAG: hypothetical protein PHE02_00335 [Lachnospiraceae bacterium]|nr:hypothetical protein [Lachnospiraceae bacterium]